MKYIKYIPSMVLPIVLTSLIIFSLGNILDVEQYGEYNLIITTISIITSTIFSITNSSLVRFYPLNVNTKTDNTYLSTMYSMQLILVLLLMFILSVLNVSIIYLIGILSVPFLNFILGYYRTKGDAFYFSIFKIVPYLIILALIWICVLFSININYQRAAMIFYTPIALASFFWIGLKILNKEISFLKWENAFAKEGLLFGKNLVIINLLHSGIAHLDKYMLKFYGYNEALGAYSFAYRLTEVIFVNFAVLMVMVFYPNLIRVYEDKNLEKTSEILSKEMNNFLIFSMFILCYFFINIEYIISYFFSQYLSYLNLFYIVMISGFFFGITYFTNKYFELSKKMFDLGKILLFTLTINFFLNILLIPVLAGYGAAISSVISYLIVIIFSFWKSKEQLNIKLESKSLLIVLILILITFLLSNVMHSLLSFIGFSFVKTDFFQVILSNIFVTIVFSVFFYKRLSLKFKLRNFFNRIN